MAKQQNQQNEERLNLLIEQEIDGTKNRGPQNE
jgi:hypothetical protein